MVFPLLMMKPTVLQLIAVQHCIFSNSASVHLPVGLARNQALLCCSPALASMTPATYKPLADAGEKPPHSVHQ